MLQLETLGKMHASSGGMGRPVLWSCIVKCKSSSLALHSQMLIHGEVYRLHQPTM